MFTYSMVAKEIEGLFEQTSLAKTAAYEALSLAQKNNDEMVGYKLKDLESFLKNLQVRMKDLDNKIEFIKNHP